MELLSEGFAKGFPPELCEYQDLFGLRNYLHCIV